MAGQSTREKASRFLSSASKYFPIEAKGRSRIFSASPNGCYLFIIFAHVFPLCSLFFRSHVGDASPHDPVALVSKHFAERPSRIFSTRAREKSIKLIGNWVHLINQAEKAENIRLCYPNFFLILGFSVCPLRVLLFGIKTLNLMKYSNE